MDFSEWKKRPIHQEKDEQGNKKVFISDGIIEQSAWNQAPFKVALLLKEAYGNAEDWSICDLIRDRWNGCPDGHMWKRASEWVYGIQHLKTENSMLPYDKIESASLTKAFLSSAIVNVKKSGGKSKSNIDDLKRYVDSDWDLIRNQIEKIKPDVVICGNTWSLINKKIETDEQVDSIQPISDLIYPAMSTYFIDFWHPANYNHRKLNYYSICSLVMLSGITK